MDDYNEKSRRTNNADWLRVDTRRSGARSNGIEAIGWNSIGVELTASACAIVGRCVVKRRASAWHRIAAGNLSLENER